MLIGFLQCGHFPQVAGFSARTYSDLYSELLAGYGFSFRTWSVVDMEFPATVSEADGWLITGSKHGAYDDVPFIPPLERFIREAYQKTIPMVGICFGHQIMAQALGGDVEKWTGGWQVGRTEYAWSDGSLALNAWHQDQVVSIPQEAEVVATSPGCRIAGLRYKRAAFSVQPHPEFDQAAVELLLEARAPGLVPQDLIDQATAAVRRPVDNTLMAEQIATFFKEAAHG